MVDHLLNKKNADNKSKLIKKLLAKKNISLSSSIIPKRDPGAAVPLSFSQERLWILDKMGMADAGYNMSYVFELSASLHIPSLKAALSQLISRHEILRTVFSSDGETPRQVVLPSLVLDLPVFAFESRERLEEAMQNRVKANFDLAKGPLLRAAVFRRTDINSAYIVQIALHHIIFDGWSGEVMQRELLALYSHQIQSSGADAIGGAGTLGVDPLPIQYADYSLWQRNKDMQREKAYWHNALSDYDSRLQIPQDYLPANGHSQEVGFCSKGYSLEFTQALTQFSQRHGATIFMSTLAAFALVACRYTHRQDVCLGVTVSGREAPELESLLGFFVNILPIRVKFDPGLSITQYMASVRRVVLDAFDHQSLPYEQLLRGLTIKRDDSLSGLVPLMIRHTNFIQKKQGSEVLAHRDSLLRDDSSGDNQGNQQDTLPIPSNAEQSAKCDIDMVFSGGTEPGERLSLLIEYASDKFSKARMERLIGHHQHVLETMFSQPEKKIGDISIFSDEEHHELLVERNTTESKVDTRRCLPQLFEQAAKRNPSATACYFGEETISFEELNQQANQLAHYLRAKGIEPEKLVGVCMRRSIDLLVSLLAIFKAGGAYVPIDPNYPTNYIDTILDDAGVDILLAKYECSSVLEKADVETIYLDREWNTIAQEETLNFVSKHCISALNASNLANVLYTSGSTGKPKGVMVPHYQLLNCFDNVWKLMPFSEGDVVAQKTTASFAVSVKELFAGLLKGYPVAIFSDEEVKDTRLFVKQLAAWHITRLNIVPSQLQLLVESHPEELAKLKALRFVVTAGEPLTKTLLDQFTRLCPHVRLFNNYGCTELNDTTYLEASSECVNSLSASRTSESHGADRFVSIGYPIQNTKLYILDGNRQPVPVGVSGELYVASMGLPRGYRHQPERTAERFIQNPFSDDPEDRLFNTGDVVRYLDDGRLEYLSRWDFQVKIRGFRIDVRQIEYLLRQHPDIASPVVHPYRACSSESEALVAYYQVKNKNLMPDTLKQYLASMLPNYMVPSFFVELDTFPFLPNGKLDRRALPGPSIQGVEEGEYLSSDLELQLSDIWKNALELPTVVLSKKSNFFDLGGSSLSAMKVIKNIESGFHLSLRLNQFFMCKSLGDLAELILHQQTQIISFISEKEGDRLSRTPSAKEKTTTVSLTKVLKSLSKERIDEYRAAISEGYSITVVNPVATEESVPECKEEVYSDGFSSRKFPVFTSQSFYFNIKKDLAHEAIGSLIKLDKPLDFNALKLAVAALVEEVETLKYAFQKHSGQWMQVYSDSYSLRDEERVVKQRLVDGDDESFYSHCDTFALDEIKNTNIGDPFLFRVLYFENSSRDKFCLTISFSHLIYDGFSERLVMSRLFDLYAYHSGSRSDLGAFYCPSAYRYYRWLEKTMASPYVLEKLSPWLDVDWSEGNAHIGNPYVYPVRKKHDYQAGNFVTKSFWVSRDVSEKVVQYFSETHGLWIDDALMLIALREVVGDDGRGLVPFWSVENGRDSIDESVVENVVGYLSVGLIVGLNKDARWSVEDWVFYLKSALQRSREAIYEFSAAYYHDAEYERVPAKARQKIKSILFPNIYFNFKGFFEGDDKTGDDLVSQPLSALNNRENEYFAGIHFSYVVLNGEIDFRITYSSVLYQEEVIDELSQQICKAFESYSQIF